MHEIKITGMSCQHCVAAVKQALEELGLQNIEVSLADGTARFDGDADADAIRAAIDDAGFDLA